MLGDLKNRIGLLGPSSRVIIEVQHTKDEGSNEIRIDGLGERTY